MSKSSKTQSKMRRLKEKRARKAAMRLRYEKYRESGQNSKSKRAKKAIMKMAKTVDHPDGKCGNPACQKCFKISFKPFLKGGKPHKMPQWMYNKWLESQKAA